MDIVGQMRLGRAVFVQVQITRDKVSHLQSGFFVEQVFQLKPLRLHSINRHVASNVEKCLPCTGLRFFTVYGPFGRPDMALFIFTKNILEGKPIDVYNFGQMKRDFTYIDDIVAGLRSAIDKPFPYEIFNLGNHRSENLMDFIHLIEEYSGRKAQINFQPIQPGDVPETYADISTATEKLGFVPRTQIREGIKLFLDWYFEYYHIKK